MPGIEKIVSYILEATYNPQLIIKKLHISCVLCFSLFLVEPHLTEIFRPPSAPTSAPQNVSVDDVNESSLTIKWKTPETIGDSGLDGYVIEYCKDGSKWRVCLCVCVFAPVPTVVSQGR